VRDGKVRVVSNDLSGNGRLLIEDLSGSDIVDMCWASASALVLSAADGRIAVFLMQQELGQLTHRLVCSWRAASGEHYASIAAATAASDHNMPIVIYAGTAAGIVNALAMYAPFNAVGLVNAGSCVNQLEFSPASASAGPCLYAATAANGVIKVELAPSLLDRSCNPVSFNPLQSVPLLSADTAVQSIGIIGAGHLLVSNAQNHVMALVDSSTLEVLQCIRVNSSESESASAPNVLFFNPQSFDGYGHVFVSRFNSTELLCFRINRQQPVPVIDWVSKQDIEYPVMCMQSTLSSSSDQHLRVVLYQTSYIRIFTIDSVSSIVASPSSPDAAAGAHVLPTQSHAHASDAPASVATASAATPAADHSVMSVASTSVSQNASTQPDVVNQTKAKVVQNADVFRSAIQISSADRSESSTAATSNVANVLSEVLGGSATPGDNPGSNDFSPKVEDAFASLSLSSCAAVANQQPHVPISPSLASSSSSVAAVPASAAAPPTSAKQDTLKMLLTAQSSGNSKKDKEQPALQPPKAKLPEVKVTEVKPSQAVAAKASAPAPLVDMSRDELDKMLQSRFEVQSSRMERELRALSESLAKKQVEYEAHMLKSVKEAIANQVNAGVSKAVSESLKPLQKSIDALVKSPTQAQDSAEALRLATAGIVRSIGADFDARLRLHTESLLARVDAMIKQQAAVPAPAPSTSTEPSAEVAAFIKAGHYDSALGLTLNENNLDLLMKVLAMLEADRVVPTLSHPVMLALIHWCVCHTMSQFFHNAPLTLSFSSSLAVGLHIQQEAKLMWLTPTGSL
jgi:hypothetical protein